MAPCDGALRPAADGPVSLLELMGGWQRSLGRGQEAQTGLPEASVGREPPGDIVWRPAQRASCTGRGLGGPSPVHIASFVPCTLEH